MDNTTRQAYLNGTNANLLIPLRSDIPLLLKWINDPEVRRFLPARGPILEKAEEDWFESLARTNTNRVFIIGTETCIPIGTIGLHSIDWVSRVATFGIMIGEKECWGKGYGAAATQLILSHAFLEMNLRKVELDVHAFNERAQRCYAKCGFVEEGRKKAHLYKDGKHHDTVFMGVFAGNWRRHFGSLS